MQTFRRGNRWLSLEQVKEFTKQNAEVSNGDLDAALEEVAEEVKLTEEALIETPVEQPAEVVEEVIEEVAEAPIEETVDLEKLIEDEEVIAGAKKKSKKSKK